MKPDCFRLYSFNFDLPKGAKINKFIFLLLFILNGFIFFGCQKGQNMATGVFNDPCLTSETTFCTTVFVPDEEITKIQAFGLDENNNEFNCYESQVQRLKPSISFGKVFNIKISQCFEKSVNDYKFLRVQGYKEDTPTTYIYFYASNLRVAKSNGGLLKFSAVADAKTQISGVDIGFLLPIETYKSIQKLIKTSEDIKQFAIDISNDPKIQKFAQQLSNDLQTQNVVKPYKIPDVVVSRFIQIASSQGQNECTKIFDYSDLKEGDKAQYPEYETVANCFDRENFLNDFEINRNPCDQQKVIDTYKDSGLLHSKIFNNLKTFCDSKNRNNFDEYWDDGSPVYPNFYKDIPENARFFYKDGFFRMSNPSQDCLENILYKLEKIGGDKDEANRLFPNENFEKLKNTCKNLELNPCEQEILKNDLYKNCVISESKKPDNFLFKCSKANCHTVCTPPVAASNATCMPKGASKELREKPPLVNLTVQDTLKKDISEKVECFINNETTAVSQCNTICEKIHNNCWLISTPPSKN